METLSIVLPFAGRDVGRYAVNGVAFTGENPRSVDDPGRTALVATDSRRMARLLVPHAADPCDFPKRSTTIVHVARLAAIEAEAVYLDGEGKRVCATIDGRPFDCDWSRLEGDFPMHERIMLPPDRVQRLAAIPVESLDRKGNPRPIATVTKSALEGYAKALSEAGHEGKAELNPAFVEDAVRAWSQFARRYARKGAAPALCVSWGGKGYAADAVYFHAETPDRVRLDALIMPITIL